MTRLQKKLQDNNKIIEKNYEFNNNNNMKEDKYTEKNTILLSSFQFSKEKKIKEKQSDVEKNIHNDEMEKNDDLNRKTLHSSMAFLSKNKDDYILSISFITNKKDYQYHNLNQKILLIGKQRHAAAPHILLTFLFLFFLICCDATA